MQVFVDETDGRSLPSSVFSTAWSDKWEAVRSDCGEGDGELQLRVRLQCSSGRSELLSELQSALLDARWSRFALWAHCASLRLTDALAVAVAAPKTFALRNSPQTDDKDSEERRPLPVSRPLQLRGTPVRAPTVKPPVRAQTPQTRQTQTQTQTNAIDLSTPVSSADSPHVKFFSSLLGANVSHEQRAAFVSFLLPFFKSSSALSWLLAAPLEKDAPIAVDANVAALLQRYIGLFAAQSPVYPCISEEMANFFRPHEVFVALAGWCNLAGCVEDLIQLFQQERCFQRGYLHPRHGDSYVCHEFGNSFETSCFALARLARFNSSLTERIQKVFQGFLQADRKRWLILPRSSPSQEPVPVPATFALRDPNAPPVPGNDWGLDNNVDLCGHATVVRCLEIVNPATRQEMRGRIDFRVHVDEHMRVMRSFVIDGQFQGRVRNTDPPAPRPEGALWVLPGEQIFNSCVPSDCTYVPCGNSSIVLLHYQRLVRLSLANGSVVWSVNLHVKAFCWEDASQTVLLVWTMLGEHARVSGLVRLDAASGAFVGDVRAMPLPREFCQTHLYGESVWCMQDGSIFALTAAYKGSGRALWKVNSSGAVVWRHNVKDDSIASFCEPWLAVTSSDDYHHGHVTLFDSRTTDAVRALNVGGITRLKHIVWSLEHDLLAIVHGQQYEKMISGFSVSSGAELWKLETAKDAKEMHGDVDGNSCPYPVNAGNSLLFFASKKGGLHVDVRTGRVAAVHVWPKEGGEIVFKSSEMSGGAVAVMYPYNQLGVAIPGRKFPHSVLASSSSTSVKGILAVVGRYCLLGASIQGALPCALCVSINPSLERSFRVAVTLMCLKRFNRAPCLRGLGMDAVRHIAKFIWKSRE